MKGIELPVNVLIIVAIGVIVLIGLVVLLGIGIGGVNPAIVELQSSKACGLLKNTHQCAQSTSTVALDDPVRAGLPAGSSLFDLCIKYKGCKTQANPADLTKTVDRSPTDQETCCKVTVCGCPATVTP